MPNSGSSVGCVVRAVPAAHQAPVGVEFLGQDHRQRGLHALSELQPVDRHRDFAVGGDLHEGRRLLRWLEGAGRLGRRLRHCQVREGAERQAAGTGQLQEAAARQRRGFDVWLRASRCCRARGSSLWSMLGNMAAPSGERAGGVGHRGADAGIGAAAADVAGHGRVDFGGGRLACPWGSDLRKAVALMIWPLWQ